MKRNFHSIHFSGKFYDRGKPVLLVANHISWWDGIWVLNYIRHFLHRNFFFMMLEEQLRKNWFFRFTGGFSIRKNSKSVVETINYTAGLLSDQKNAVLIFPTGKIQSLHKNEFIFEKGIEKILQKTKNEIQVIFIVNLVDFFSNPKPALFTYFEEYSGQFSTSEIQSKFNLFYQICIENQKQKE
jgi:1-acyl-sn-glycerol-3-phosphate acyltransferase